MSEGNAQDKKLLLTYTEAFHEREGVGPNTEEEVIRKVHLGEKESLIE